MARGRAAVLPPELENMFCGVAGAALNGLLPGVAGLPKARAPPPAGVGVDPNPPEPAAKRNDVADKQAATMELIAI